MNHWSGTRLDWRQWTPSPTIATTTSDNASSFRQRRTRVFSAPFVRTHGDHRSRSSQRLCGTRPLDQVLDRPRGLSIHDTENRRCRHRGILERCLRLEKRPPAMAPVDRSVTVGARNDDHRYSGRGFVPLHSAVRHTMALRAHREQVQTGRKRGFIRLRDSPEGRYRFGR